MITQTSLLSYRSISPHVSQLQEEVIALVSLYGPMTSEQIVARSGRIKDTVAPRITELKQNNVLGVLGYGKNTRGKTVQIFTLIDRNSKGVSMGLHSEVVPTTTDCPP